MEILSTVLPVIIMLALGKLFAIKKTISKETVTGMKSLISNILLPVVIFNALLTSNFSSRSLILSLVVYISFSAILVIATTLLKGHTKYKMAPYLLVGCEGGMLGYSLYTSLYGAKALHNLMELDLGQILYAFTFFILLIQLANNTDENMDKKAIVLDALKTPIIWIVIIALILNFAGLGRMLLSSSFGTVYNSIISMITSPVTALILLCVGYELEFDKELMSSVIKVGLLRMVIMALIGTFLLTVCHSLIISHKLFTAVILYMTLPTQMMTPIFIKDEKEATFASTFISCYTIVTIIAFIMIATFIA